MKDTFKQIARDVCDLTLSFTAILFAIFALVLLSRSLWATLIMLAGASLLLTPVSRRISQVTGFSLTRPKRAATGALLFVVAIAAVQASKAPIAPPIAVATERQKSQRVQRIPPSEQAAGEIEDIKNEKELLTILDSYSDDDFASIAAAYGALEKISPDNEMYRDMHSHFKEMHSEQQRLARNKKAAEIRSRRRKALGTTWKYQNFEDTISRQRVYRATIRSSNEFEFDFPYGGIQRATLVLQKHPRFGGAVFLQLAKGQFSCLLDDCHLAVRFGEGAVRHFRTSPPSSNETTVRFVSDHDSFLRGLRSADEVHIEAAFFQEGLRTFRFETDNLQWD